MLSGRYIAVLGLVMHALAGCSIPGSQWDRQRPFAADDLHQGWFIDDEHGWIITHSTGKVFSTEDAAETWRQVGSVEPIYLESIAFADSEHGWMCGEKNAIFKTEDGGRNWIEMPLSNEPLGLGVVHFVSEDIGFVAGSAGPPRTALVLLTEDGGLTWHDCSEGLAARWLSDAFARNEDGVLLVGGLRAIVRSVDQGRTWTDAVGEIGGMVRGLAFADKTTAWAVGHNGLVMRSDDAGRSWQALPPFTENRLRDVEFINDREGFIVGDGNEEPVSLWTTLDAGKTWKPAAGDFPDLHRIVLSPSYVYLVGDTGAVYRRGIGN